MNCLVTGCAGFIGSTLSDRLLTLGHSVLGVDSFTDYYPRGVKLANLENALQHPRFHLVEGDLLDLDLSQLLDGIDWIFHQAAQPGVRTSWGSTFDIYVRDNILATQKLLESASRSQISRMVYASSSSVYGDSDELPLKESARPVPVSPYGVTKLAAEHLCCLYAVNFGVPVVSLRYFTVYGPRQRPDMAFHRFIRAVLEGRELLVHGDGNQTRDFTYVADICCANVLAAGTVGVDGRLFNVGGGSRVSINEVVEAIRKITGHRMAVKHIEDQKGDVRHTLSDTSAAREILGYAPRTSLYEGLAKQVESLAGNR